MKTSYFMGKAAIREETMTSNEGKHLVSSSLKREKSKGNERMLQ